MIRLFFLLIKYTKIFFKLHNMYINMIYRYTLNIFVKLYCTFNVYNIFKYFKITVNYDNERISKNFGNL
jgi:hypothetical protein